MQVRPQVLIVLAVSFAAAALTSKRLMSSPRPNLKEPILPGDSLVANPNFRQTLAIDIAAPPEAIWPWLAQMGRGRGGLYSYDWLDRLAGILDAPSAKQILPEFQDLRSGDVIAVGRGDFPVREAVPNRHLLLAGTEGDVDWSWCLSLEPTDMGTRLISRCQGVLPAGLGGALLRLWLTPAARIMTRRMLQNLRSRAESPVPHLSPLATVSRSERPNPMRITR